MRRGPCGASRSCRSCSPGGTVCAILAGSSVRSINPISSISSCRSGQALRANRALGSNLVRSNTEGLIERVTYDINSYFGGY